LVFAFDLKTLLSFCISGNVTIFVNGIDFQAPIAVFVNSLVCANAQVLSLTLISCLLPAGKLKFSLIFFVFAFRCCHFPARLLVGTGQNRAIVVSWGSTFSEPKPFIVSTAFPLLCTSFF
jgi:hypothetical protein